MAKKRGKIRCYHTALKNKPSVVLTSDGDVEAAIDEHGILYLEDYELKAIREGGEARIVTEKEEGFIEPPVKGEEVISSVAKAKYDMEIENLEKQIEELKDGLSPEIKELKAKLKEVEEVLNSSIIKYDEEIKTLNKEKTEMVKAIGKLEAAKVKSDKEIETLNKEKADLKKAKNK